MRFEYLIAVGIIGFLYLISSRLTECVNRLRAIEDILCRHIDNTHAATDSISEEMNNILVHVQSIDSAADEWRRDFRKIKTPEDERCFLEALERSRK